MGLLSAAQITAITAGARVRQVFKIYTPRASGSSTFDAVTIHDDDPSNPTRRCLKAGRREVTGYNISLAVPGKLEAGTYAPEFDNSDAYFCPEYATNVFYNSTGSYQADPQECDLEHKVYVWDAATPGWSELTMVAYRGRIEDVQYEQAGASGLAGASAVIVCKSLAALSSVLDYCWTEDDGETIDTGTNITG